MMTGNKAFAGLLYFLCLILFMTSCKSVKPVVAESTTEVTSSQRYLKLVLDNASVSNYFSSKIKLGINLDDKDLTVNGSLRIKKNEMIQLSIAPFLGIEVAKVEITPEYILIIDRMNKRYVQAPLSLLKSLGNTDLDFYSLQALFLNELFLSGIQTIGIKDFSLFDFSKKPEGITVVQPKETTDVHLSFTTITADARLTACRIASGESFLFEWLYADFEPFAGKMFPSLMELNLRNQKNKASVVMTFSKMNEDRNEIFRTEIPKKYKQVNINELIKQLMNI